MVLPQGFAPHAGLSSVEPEIQEGTGPVARSGSTGPRTERRDKRRAVGPEGGPGGRTDYSLVERCSENKACESACGCAAQPNAPDAAGDVGDCGDVGSEPRIEPDAVSML